MPVAWVVYNGVVLVVVGVVNVVDEVLVVDVEGFVVVRCVVDDVVDDVVEVVVDGVVDVVDDDVDVVLREVDCVC